MRRLSQRRLWIDSESSLEYREISQKKPLTVRGELSGWTMIASFIRKGMGIGLIPDFMAEDDWILFKCPKVEYEIWAIRPKGQQLLTPAAAFLDTFTE